MPSQPNRAAAKNAASRLESSRQVTPYSAAVVTSMNTRLSSRAPASPPMLSAMAASGGYTIGDPDR